MTTTVMSRDEQTETLRANLRELIQSSGRTLQEIIDETGIPRSTLYKRLNVQGSAIYIDEVWEIWKACGKPGSLSDLMI